MLDAAAARQERLLLWTVGGLQFMYLLDYLWMMPLGPALMRTLGFDTLQLGLLMSAYAWASGLSTLLAAPWIERGTRQTQLRVLTLLFMLALLACALATQWATLLVARMAAGALGGLLSVVSKAWLADSVPVQRQGRALGWVMSAFALASVAGVPAALLLTQRLGSASAFVALAVLGAGLLVLQTQVAAAAPRAAAPPRVKLGQVLGEARHRRALALSACIMVAGFGYTPFIPSYLQLNGGLDSHGLALVYLAGGAAALLSAVLIGRGSDHFGALPTFSALALLAMPVLLGLALLEPLLQAWGGPPRHIGWVPAAVGVGLLFVTVNGRMVAGTALVTAAALVGQRGAFLALNSAVQSAAIGVSTLVGAMLIGRNPDGSLAHAWHAALAAALAGALSVWLAVRVHRATHFTPTSHAQP